MHVEKKHTTFLAVSFIVYLLLVLLTFRMFFMPMKIILLVINLWLTDTFQNFIEHHNIKEINGELLRASPYVAQIWDGIKYYPVMSLEGITCSLCYRNNYERKQRFSTFIRQCENKSVVGVLINVVINLKFTRHFKEPHLFHECTDACSSVLETKKNYWKLIHTQYILSFNLNLPCSLTLTPTISANVRHKLAEGVKGLKDPYSPLLTSLWISVYWSKGLLKNLCPVNQTHTE